MSASHHLLPLLPSRFCSDIDFLLRPKNQVCVGWARWPTEPTRVDARGDVDESMADVSDECGF